MIPDPANTLLLVEKPGYENNYVSRTGLSGILSAQLQIDLQSDLNGDGSMHYLFADGHVALLDPTETVGDGDLEKPKGMWTLDPND